MDVTPRRRPKRSKLAEGYWECSVCTYRNSPEAFKCDMCDVRKGTSTRKPRLNSQLVAQQVAQQYAPPAKKEKGGGGVGGGAGGGGGSGSSSSNVESGPIINTVKPKEEREKKPKLQKEKDQQKEKELKEPKEPKDKDTSTPPSNSLNNKKAHRPARLKNIDRSSGTSMEVTVGNVTVIITDYKPKKERTSTSSLESQGSNATHNSNNNLGPSESVDVKASQDGINGHMDMESKS